MSAVPRAGAPPGEDEAPGCRGPGAATDPHLIAGQARVKVPDPADIAAHLNRERAYAIGYRDGYHAGVDVTVGRYELGVEVPPDLSPSLAAFREARNAGPCSAPRCGACAARRAAIERNRAAFGQDDYPGRAA